MNRTLPEKDVKGEIWVSGRLVGNHLTDIKTAFPRAGQANRHQALSDMFRHDPRGNYVDASVRYDAEHRTVRLDIQNHKGLEGLEDEDRAKQLGKDIITQKREFIEGPITDMEVYLGHKKVYDGKVY